MKINTKIVIFFLYTVFVFICCTSKGDIIIEPKFGTFEFKTYTIDTFRFKVILNDEVLTDSLLTPKGSFTGIVKFFGSSGKLLILDAGNNDQVILDSVIQMKIGITSISIVQFEQQKKPAPPPVPNEPPPAPGNYKVRIQYIRPLTVSVPFFDTVKCVVYDYTGIAIDTVDLAQYRVTPFYEASAVSRQIFRIKLLRTDFRELHTTPSIPKNIESQSGGFKTAVVYGTEKVSSSRYVFTIDIAY